VIPEIMIIDAPCERLAVTCLAHRLIATFITEEPPPATAFELTNDLPKIAKIKLPPELFTTKQVKHWYEPCLKRRRKR
jgi:hypothetical protein